MSWGINSAIDPNEPPRVIAASYNEPQTHAYLGSLLDLIAYKVKGPLNGGSAAYSFGPEACAAMKTEACNCLRNHSQRKLANNWWLHPLSSAYARDSSEE